MISETSSSGAGKDDGNRLELDDRHDTGRRGRVDDVAGIDKPEPRSARQRRADGRVAQFRLRVVDSGLVALDLCLQLVDRRLLRIELLPAGEVFLAERLVALKVELSVLQLSLVGSFFRGGLIQRRLIGARVDLGENVALLDHLSLFEIDLCDLTIHTAADRDRVIRLHHSETGEINRKIAFADDGYGDRNLRRRGGRGALPTPVAMSIFAPAEIGRACGRKHNDHDPAAPAPGRGGRLH